MYVVHIKINMFTTETRKKKDEYIYYRNTEKKGYVVHIKTSMFTTEYKKNVVLHILKLVCLLQK